VWGGVDRSVPVCVVKSRPIGRSRLLEYHLSNYRYCSRIGKESVVVVVVVVIVVVVVVVVVVVLCCGYLYSSGCVGMSQVGITKATGSVLWWIPVQEPYTRSASILTAINLLVGRSMSEDTEDTCPQE